ncbi:MAG TPA: GNAT family N-acetyltransferase [Candidatus Sulfotelmatobacter sp.]|nr:GNAT family N-acetyltransferase [Candidatus Sulfotelmatobacter sp.]
MPYSIAPMLPEHWNAVREIYAQGIATGNATFETELPGWERWDRGHRQDCRLVAVEGDVIGWAALSPVSARHVYRGIAEVSVYVAAAARRRGVGRSLLKALVHQSEESGIWTLQAGIFPENTSSIALHKACGFREVGVRRRIGKMGELWRDVVLLERRSTKVGI